MKLKIMTYNIASCRNYKLGPDFRPITRDLDLYAKAMQKLEPDLCGLNEVDYKLPRSCCVKMAKFLGDALGYESAFAPAVTWGLGTYGNGFISKYPIKDVEIYPIPDPPAKTENSYYETRVISSLPISVLPEQKPRMPQIPLWNSSRDAKIPSC